MNQKSAKLMSENVLSSEMGDAPFLVGYVGQDYNSVNRNASFLVCSETIAVLASERGSKKAKAAAVESLLVSHLLYFIKTQFRIDGLFEFMMSHRDNAALVARLQDLQGDLKTAQGFSRDRIRVLLERKGVQDSLDENTLSLLAENGF
ncbi:MAG: hypothetical protein AAGC68_13975 [Verrucomicrobiota bacterium]